MQQSYRYHLDRSSKKFKCPQCGSKSFVLYIDAETKEYLPENVGRCDRENNCGYHYTAGNFFKDNQYGHQPFINKAYYKPEPVLPVDYMPLDLVEATIKNNGFMKSNFAAFMLHNFGITAPASALLKYFVGRSKVDNGTGCIFWRIDIEHRVRTGKIMSYNPDTGKRNKDQQPGWVHTTLKPFNHQLCFFGEHLLNEYPGKTVAVVESEKTAIIASMYMPQYNWIATGGASGCKWREWDVYKVFWGKNVLLFPDFGYYNKKTEKTCWQEWSERAERIRETANCSIEVSRILEEKLDEAERVNDYDLSDLLMSESPF